MYYLWGHPERNPLLIFQYLENFGIELGDQIVPDETADAIDLIVIDIDTVFDEIVENIFGSTAVEEFPDGEGNAVSVDHISKAIAVRIEWLCGKHNLVDLE